MDAMQLLEDLVHINNVPIPVTQELQKLVTINAEPSSPVQKLWDSVVMENEISPKTKEQLEKQYTNRKWATSIFCTTHHPHHPTPHPHYYEY